MKLPDLTKLACEYDVSEIIATNLDYIPDKRLDILRIFSNHNEKVNREYIKILKKSRKLGKKCGVNVIYRALKCSEQAVCIEDPLNNLFISVDGYVSPCIYLHLPTKTKYIPRFFHGKLYDIEKLYLGNIKYNSLNEIWLNDRYIEFRDSYLNRLDSPDIDIFSLCNFLRYRDFYIYDSSPPPFLCNLLQVVRNIVNNVYNFFQIFT